MGNRLSNFTRTRKKRKRQIMRGTFLVACCVVFAGICVSTYLHFSSPAAPAEKETQTPTADTNKEGAESITSEPTSISLIAVGDNLIHNTLLKDASNGDGSYDFTPFYEDIKPYVETADIALVNQESPLGTGEAAGYPSFNTPQACGDALVQAGFDVISHANNHAMDSGSSAVYDTLDFWDSYANQGIVRIGIARDASDRANVRYVERNGIKVGFLAYTYGLNGYSLPDNNPDLVSLIDKDKMASELATVKAACDAVVVMIHWGEEYQLEENNEQNELAEFLTEQGATLIIGSHPHVCQPCEWIEAENGNRAFCLYSTGNFISAQNKTNTMLEAMLQVTLTKQSDGTVVVENPGVMPLVCHFNTKWRGYRVMPLDDYTNALAETHALVRKGCDVSPSNLRSIAQSIFGSYLIDKTIPTTHTASDGASA